MKHSSSEKVVAVCAAALLVWVIATLAGFWSWLTQAAGQKDAASWVQAVGSIVAIIATVGAVLFQQWLQQRSKLREERRARRQVLMAFEQAVVACVRQVEWVEKGMRTGWLGQLNFCQSYDAERPQHVANALRELPAGELKNFRLISRTRRAAVVMTELIEMVKAHTSFAELAVHEENAAHNFAISNPNEYFAYVYTKAPPFTRLTYPLLLELRKTRALLRTARSAIPRE